MKKYHADIHMPEDAANLSFAALVKYTRHARRSAVEDRYGKIELPTVFDSRKARLIEAKYKDGRVWRTLYRQPYNEDLDLNLVIEPDTRTVVTVWLNENTDTHATLNEEEYATV